MARQCSRGFTLIELMITLVVIGVLAAIAIPSLASAIDRSKQKRTMSDMRTIGTAVEAYAVDNGNYPVATTSLGLLAAISPTYLRPISPNDGWDRPYVIDAATSAYTISSAGKDGAVSGCVIGVITTRLDQDICFSHGQFIQYPQGPQQ